MTYSVELTEQAESDLRSIFEYIAFELNSLQNATGQLNRLEKSIKGLKQMPERFKIYDREPWRSRNLRIMPVDNYLVFYIPNVLNNSFVIYLMSFLIFYLRKILAF